MIYDQPHNETFCRDIESIQYKAALAITGAIQGTSREKLYQELGLESLCDRRRYRRLVYFFNIVHGNCPEYLSELLPPKILSRNPQRANLFYEDHSNSNFYSNSFFPFCIKAWNQLGPELRNSASISIFKASLLKFYRPKPAPIFNVLDPGGLKLLSRLRVGLSHLRDHKFRHNFFDTINPLCSCNIESETTSHYLLHCSFYVDIRKTLLDKIIDLIGPIANLSDVNLVKLLLYGDLSYNLEINASILKCTIAYLKTSERFDIPLL